MSRFFHGFLHVLAIAAQFVNIAAVPPKWQPLIAIAVGAAQGGLGLSQHPKE